MPCETEESVVQAESQTQVSLDLPAGVPPLGTLYLYASGSCNLACRHCWITPNYVGADYITPEHIGARPLEHAKNGRHVPLEYVAKAIREGKPLGLHAIKLTGGEPTLHPHFRELVNLIAEAGLNITCETNGTLIDDDLAAFLKATPQFSFVSVSLDGADAETHDALRSVPGSFRRAVNGIEALVRVGFRPQLICTLHCGNIAQVDEVVALAEELGCGSVKFNLIQEMGRGELFAAQQGLSIEQCIAENRRVERELVPRSQVRIHFDIPFAYRPLPRLLRGDLGRCGILTILGLLSGGELSLCGVGTTVPALVYGHIERDDLRDVWCHSPGLIEIREKIPFQLEGICGECLHRDLCLGSCVANNYHAAGKLNAPYVFCDRAEASGLFPASRKRGRIANGG
jgi:SynChlorMet cassette radical SAM/SPASM protein ScmF